MQPFKSSSGVSLQLQPTVPRRTHRSSSKLSTVNQRSCDGCFWKAGQTDYYDYERTSTPAGISPNGNSFQTDTTSQKAIAVTSIQDWLKYNPSLPRHSRSQPGILDCLLV
ncbi:hypothetical protein PROQFM164_S02g002714 [Penicillium roqueforti FM164]|uniref:Uncharacterized protein n=1 Tax=Penicillium roqueforti (strain FM164) TaxID=1365484 RepID=W6Q756_PENRF|nr:hypothetical protein PROQFM164_S02g002714 [Penicillium roqueforti FM164]